MDSKVTQMKPYGWLRTQGEKYMLLNPHPVRRLDDHWNDGTYAFFVAKQIGDDTGPIWWEAATVITNSFALELDARIPVITVSRADVCEEEPTEQTPVEPEFDDFLWHDEDPFGEM